MMQKKMFIIYVTFILVYLSEGKGGRGGGGGRSSGRSSRSQGGRSSSVSSFGGTHNSIRTNGGWFHGFFHSSPYQYTYRPIYINQKSTSSYHVPNEEEGELDSNTGSYAVGYSVSRALSSDFFSIFGVVHDISKYPEKIKNKELFTTTTEGPVATYNINDLVTPKYTLRSSANVVVPKGYTVDDEPFGIEANTIADSNNKTNDN